MLQSACERVEKTRYLLRGHAYPRGKVLTGGVTLTLEAHRTQVVFKSSYEPQTRLWSGHQAPHRSRLASLFGLRVLKEGRHFVNLVCSSWLYLWLTLNVIKGKITFWFSPKSFACLSVSDLP